jgi:hypothetical protein
VPTGWTARLGETIEVASWNECVGLLLSLGGRSALYRGQGSFDWELKSSLERALLDLSSHENERFHGLMMSMVVDEKLEKWIHAKELELLQSFRQEVLSYRIPDLPEAWDLIGWWELMQHHGAPTRLMDWTTSPFIAIWFALNGRNDATGDMALWVYDREVAEQNLGGLIDRLVLSEDYDSLDDRSLQNRIAKAAIENGQRILVPVNPRQFSRAVAQQSVLTVTPDIGTGRPADWWLRGRLATRIRLREEWVTSMRDACRSLGLSHASLFRDLDSLGASVARNFAQGIRTYNFY